MAENTIEDMLESALKDNTAQDFGEKHAERIEEEYMEMINLSRDNITSVSLEKKDLSSEEILDELKEKLSGLKKRLNACKNVKNSNKTKINTQNAQQRTVLRKRIAQLNDLINTLKNSK